MTAILGGLGAAIMFAAGTVCSSRSSRMIGPWAVVSWVMLFGLLLNVAMIAVVGGPGPLDAGLIGWMAAAGGGNIVGLLLAYTALRHGKVGVIAPILSTEGAIAAVIAVTQGETLGATSAVLLVIIVIGVVLSGLAPETVPVEGERKVMAVLLASAAAVAFGISLYATGHLSPRLPLPWVVLPARLIGVVALTIPLAVTRRLTLTRKALPLVVTTGCTEVIGFASYTWGAREGIAVAAVLVSQFAAISGIAAYLLFRERLSRLQLGGVSLLVISVSILSAVRA